MEQSSKLIRFARKFSLGVLLFSLLLNTAILQAQNAPKPKRTVIEVDVSKLNKLKYPISTFRLTQWFNPLTPETVAKGQPIGNLRYKIILNLERANTFVVLGTENGSDYGAALLYLEPGDSLFIIANDDMDNPIITGKGANNNPYNFDDRLPEPSEDFSEEYENYWLSKIYNLHNGYKSSLEKRKTVITAEYYNYLSIRYTYDLYNRKISYILDYIRKHLAPTPENPEKVFNKAVEFQKKIFPELLTKTLVNDSFLHVREYREFIGGLMLYQFALKTQTYKSDLIRPNRTLFDVANKQLPPKTGEFYTAFLIKKGLCLPDNKDAVAPLLHEYLKKYPTSAYKDTLENLFNTRGNMGINKPVPDFILKNEKGQPVKLSSFKGKPVCLAFYDDEPNNWHYHEVIAETAKSYPEVKLVFVYCGADTAEFLKMTQKFPQATKLMNYNWATAKEFDIYEMGVDSRVYLIDRNGILMNYDPDEELDFYLFRLVNQSKASSNKSGIWGLIGLFAGITATLAIAVWLLFRWRIRYIRKREEKKRKQIEIELRGIRAQMNPHFMFNSLGSIQNLINQSKVQEANLYLSKFAGLMRLILNNSEKEFVPLAGEIDAIRTYCELEQLRFGFEYNIDVENNIDIFNTEIPGMLIQPYVENAILHGINYLENRAGKLDISFKMENNQLVCTINDNGIGRQASQDLKSTRAPSSNGFGVRLSKERIDLLNSQGKNISLTITDKTNGKGEAEGTTVEIKIETND